MAQGDEQDVLPGGAGNGGGGNGGGHVVEDPKVFILSRELSEVHLLLDNLSANPDTTIAALSSRAPPDGLPEDWIERICRISWPPQGSQIDQAEQAALLIRAKDYLNRLSAPASGSTIAFTLLVTQEDDPEMESGGWSPGTGSPPSRSSLACSAYPDLTPKARRFRKIVRGINMMLLLWLVATCLISWYVAYGNSALGDLATAQATLDAADKRVSDAEAGRTDDGDSGTGTVAQAQGQAATEYVMAYCERPKEIKPLVVDGVKVMRYENVAQMQACEDKARSQSRVDQVKQTLAAWLFRRGGDDVDVTFAAAFTNIMGTAVLPFLYGFLGAGAAVVRSLSRKIKRSLLSPRDIQLSIQQLALGAVVGACIGLFIAQPDTGGPADAGLLGPVALSGSAISFVAGFGVEAVFQALEALIARIFNITTPGEVRRDEVQLNRDP